MNKRIKATTISLSIILIFIIGVLSVRFLTGPLYPVYKISKIEIVKDVDYTNGIFDIDFIDGYTHFNKTTRMTDLIFEIVNNYNKNSIVIIRNHYSKTWDKYSNDYTFKNISQNIKDIQISNGHMTIFLAEDDIDWNIAEYIYNQFKDEYDISKIDVCNSNSTKVLSFNKIGSKWERVDSLIKQIEGEI